MLNKKKFDSKGSFATSQQALSAFFTSLMIFFILFSFYFSKWIILFGLLILFIAQLIIEYKFLLFAKKHFGLKMLFFSIFGIQVINLGILLGTIYFLINTIKFFLKGKN